MQQRIGFVRQACPAGVFRSVVASLHTKTTLLIDSALTCESEISRRLTMILVELFYNNSLKPVVGATLPFKSSQQLLSSCN